MYWKITWLLRFLLLKAFLTSKKLNFTHPIYTTSRYPNTHTYLTVGYWVFQLAKLKKQ
nr:MAG TPA: hypothetical protein [Caudoviricetes sp.]